MILNKFSVFSSATLDVTPVQVPLPTAGFQTNKVRMQNRSATNLVAYKLVDLAAAAPSLDATVGSVNCGDVLAPGESIELEFSSALALWVVGSAAASSIVCRISN